MDSSPCIVTLNWVLRTILLILQCVIIGCLPVVVLFTYKYKEIKVQCSVWTVNVVIDCSNLSKVVHCPEESRIVPDLFKLVQCVIISCRLVVILFT